MFAENAIILFNVKPGYELYFAFGAIILITGLNIVGLKRRNFSQEAIDALEKAYHFIYNSNLNVTQALERIKNEMQITAEVRHVIDFIEKSKRGIIWRRK